MHALPINTHIYHISISRSRSIFICICVYTCIYVCIYIYTYFYLYSRKVRHSRTQSSARLGGTKNVPLPWRGHSFSGRALVLGKSCRLLHLLEMPFRRAWHLTPSAFKRTFRVTCKQDDARAEVACTWSLPQSDASAISCALCLFYVARPPCLIRAIVKTRYAQPSGEF